MHLEFKKEFKELLGEGYYGKEGLPKVFIEKKYIDEVEEIQKLHDDKKLEKLLDCCWRIYDIEGDDGGCEACGDIKFVPCETCYASCKIYYEGDYEEHDNCEVGGWVWIPKVFSLQWKWPSKMFHVLFLVPYFILTFNNENGLS